MVKMIEISEKRYIPHEEVKRSVIDGVTILT